MIFMFKDGNIDQVKQLCIPSKRVIKEGISIRKEDQESRIQLWNDIRKNRESYQKGECGIFLPELDIQFLSEFDISLLVLASAFAQDEIPFEPSKNYFSKRELLVYEMIQRYNSLELLSVQDLVKKISRKEEKVLKLLRDYYLGMDPWVERTLEDSSVQMTVRYYLKKKWDGYKGKINQAVSQASTQLDWLRINLQQWMEYTESEKIKLFEETLEKATQKAEGDLNAEREQLSTEHARLLEFDSSLRQKAIKIDKKAQELLEQQKKIDADLQKIQSAIQTSGVPSSSGSRFVTSKMACQYEINFVERVKEQLKKPIYLKNAVFKKIKIKTHFQSNKHQQIDLLEPHTLPENIAIIALLQKQTPLSLMGPKFVISAYFFSRFEKYLQKGYDLDPLTLEEIIPIIKQNLEVVNKNKFPRLLCIASPTGFDTDIDNFIHGNKQFRKFYSPDLKVCFLDLDTGSVKYNKNDPLCKDFAVFCELEIESEKQERIYRCVEQALMAEVMKKDFALFSDIENICGDNPLTKSAFYEYAETHNHVIRYLSDIGLVIDFKVGKSGVRG